MINGYGARIVGPRATAVGGIVAAIVFFLGAVFVQYMKSRYNPYSDLFLIVYGPLIFTIIGILILVLSILLLLAPRPPESGR